MKQAAIYTRVSSDEQVKGYSLDNQEEKLKEYCQSDGLTLYAVYREEGVSGSRRSRPELDKLMEAAKQKKFNTVLVYKLDRFSRNLKNLLDLVGTLESNGVGFKSITETFDTTSPMGKYMLQNMGSIAELEREMIRERTLAGQRKYREEGNWYGRAPYGYNINKETHRLEINKEESRWVKEMFKWFVEERLSGYAVHKRINDLKVPTKYDNLGIEKRVNGKGWWKKRTIIRILTNKVYAGSFTYKDDTTVKTPKIITKELFKLAQVQLQKNKKHSIRNTKREYLFAHLLECGECNGKFGSYWHKSTKPGGRKRYLCYNSRTWIKKDPCKAPTVAEKRLDEPVWQAITDFLLNPDIAFKQMERIQKRENGNDEIKDKLKELNLLIKQVKERKRKLIDLYLNQKVDEDIYLEKLSGIEGDLAKYIEDKKKYDSLVMSKTEKKSRLKSIEEIFKQFKFNIKSINYSQKREVLKMMVDKIILKGEDIAIHCDIPYAYSLRDSKRIY